MTTDPSRRRRSDNYEEEEEEEEEGRLLLSLSRSQQVAISERTPFRFLPSSHPTSIGGGGGGREGGERIEKVEPFIPLFRFSYPPSTTTSSSTLLPPELILTPPRLSKSELELVVETLNDFNLVSRQLVGPPFPYTLSMAREWSEARFRQTRRSFKALLTTAARRGGDEREEEEEEDDEESSTSFEGLSFASIRENDDKGEWVGEVGIVRWEFREVGDLVERERLKRENDERKLGHPELVWSFGYYLRPKYQGQGIMARVVSSLFESVLKGYLNAGIVRVSAFRDNVASIKTLEKCGMVQTRVTFWHQVDEGRGGGQREEIVLEWNKRKE